MEAFRKFARFVMVKATMTVRFIHLVVPLAQKATAMRIKDTTASKQVWSCAVAPLSNRCGDVDSTINRLGL